MPATRSSTSIRAVHEARCASTQPLAVNREATGKNQYAVGSNKVRFMTFSFTYCGTLLTTTIHHFHRSTKRMPFHINVLTVVALKAWWTACRLSPIWTSVNPANRICKLDLASPCPIWPSCLLQLYLQCVQRLQ